MAGRGPRSIGLAARRMCGMTGVVSVCTFFIIERDSGTFLYSPQCGALLALATSDWRVATDCERERYAPEPRHGQPPRHLVSPVAIVAVRISQVRAVLAGWALTSGHLD